jgi:S1-C subfamily serine protease
MMNLKQLAIAVVLGTAGLCVGAHAEAAITPYVVFGMSLGATLGDSTTPPAPPGAAVLSTVPGGPFDHAGIQPMDVVTAVQGTTCTDASSCEALIDNPPAGTKLLFQVWDHTSGTYFNLWVTLA